MTAGAETRVETGAVRDIEVTAEAADEEPETKPTATESGGLAEVPEEEPEALGVLSPVVARLFWGRTRSINMTGRLN